MKIDVMKDHISMQDLFYKHYSNLEEEAILNINEKFNSPEFNNVIVGLEKQCFSLWLMDDVEDIRYRLFYITSQNKLEGDLIELSVSIDYRDELVMFFSNFLAHNYKGLDPIDVFNTFQKQTRGMLEKLKYLTIASTELAKYSGQNPHIMAKDVKGIIPIKLIDKTEFYKEFFGNKSLIPETEDCDHLYLMLNKRNDYIKIGKSKKPKFREKTLQGEEPDIDMITFWQAPSRVERELHKKFKEKRQRGEWFKLSFIDLRQIKEYMESYE